MCTFKASGKHWCTTIVLPEGRDTYKFTLNPFLHAVRMPDFSAVRLDSIMCSHYVFRQAPSNAVGKRISVYHSVTRATFLI